MEQAPPTYKRFNPRKAHLHICPECDWDIECNPEELGIDECPYPKSVLCGECR